jgi:glucosyl-3-phosphoglycerate synthase
VTIEVLAQRNSQIAVCLPARNEAASIGPMVETLADLRERGLIDQLVVIDGASRDGTAAVAADAGAEVYQRDDLLPSFGVADGKGDAIWRAQAVVSADILCFLDADLHNFHEAQVLALVAPLVRDPSVQLVKGGFERRGGRVTELTARPLLRIFYPALAAFRQPLSGQFAIRRSLLSSLPVPSGYGVEIGLLIGASRQPGVASTRDVDIGRIETAHQTLSNLKFVASDVVETLFSELAREGRIDPAVLPPARQEERPPFATVGVLAGGAPGAAARPIWEAPRQGRPGP